MPRQELVDVYRLDERLFRASVGGSAPDRRAARRERAGERYSGSTRWRWSATAG